MSAPADTPPTKFVAIKALAIKACATCGKPAVERFRPFCSRRCADVDLNRWFKEVYAVPGVEEDDEEGAQKLDDEPP